MYPTFTLPVFFLCHSVQPEEPSSPSPRPRWLEPRPLQNRSRPSGPSTIARWATTPTSRGSREASHRSRHRPVVPPDRNRRYTRMTLCTLVGVGVAIAMCMGVLLKQRPRLLSTTLMLTCAVCIHTHVYVHMYMYTVYVCTLFARVYIYCDHKCSHTCYSHSLHSKKQCLNHSVCVYVCILFSVIDCSAPY